MIGVFIRPRVCAIACFHCAPDIPSTRPVSSAATNTPVPAADSQLSTNCAASGLALAAPTGGIRWTRLWSAGMSHTGRDSVPVSLEPNSVVSNLVPASRPSSQSLLDLKPQNTQHAIRIAHGSHAYAVWPSVYLYFQVDGAVLASAALPDSRSDLSRKRCLGCQTKRRNSAVQITENTPETTSVVRYKLTWPDAKYCMIAKLAPDTTAAGQTSRACFQLPPSILTNRTTSQNGTS